MLLAPCLPVVVGVDVDGVDVVGGGVGAESVVAGCAQRVFVDCELDGEEVDSAFRAVCSCAVDAEGFIHVFDFVGVVEGERHAVCPLVALLCLPGEQDAVFRVVLVGVCHACEREECACVRDAQRRAAAVSLCGVGVGFFPEEWQARAEYDSYTTEHHFMYSRNVTPEQWAAYSKKLDDRTDIYCDGYGENGWEGLEIYYEKANPNGYTDAYVAYCEKAGLMYYGFYKGDY